MKMKRILVGILAVAMMLSLCACGGGKEPEPTAAPVVQTVTYGIAGDMFRKYVNAVSSDNFEEVMTYLNVGENDIVNQTDVKMYLMTQKIGNLIGQKYSTKNIVVREEGNIRGVTFKYISLGKENSFDGWVILVGTEWKVYLPELYTSYAKLCLPKGEYKKIEIDGKKLDAGDYTVDGDYYVYSLPLIAYFEKPVVIERSDGGKYEGNISWKYSTNNSGKVTDNAVRTIKLADFSNGQAQVAEPDGAA